MVEPFEIPADWPVWAGFVHPTVVIFFTRDGDGHIYVIAEHWRRRALPSQHVADLEALAGSFGRELGDIWPWAAGSDCFVKRQSKESEAGESIADQYSELGVALSRADVDRVNDAARLLDLLGDVDGSPAIPSRLSVFTSCPNFIVQVPAMVHSPTRSEDVRKVDCNDDGRGGDDAYDAGRYGLMVDSVGVAASTSITAEDPLDEMDDGLRW